VLKIGHIDHHKAAVLSAVCVILSSLLGLSGCDPGRADQKTGRADVVVIDAMSAFGHLDRAPVSFPHDLHTVALTVMNKSCETCHIRMDTGKYYQKFLRLTDDNKDDVMQLYHDNCIGCHQELAREGIESGPVTCGECHQRDPLYVSTRQEIGFDKSLHHRHMTNKKKDCSQCHHIYDDKEQELVYVKGEESSCRDCHLEEVKGKIPAMSTAAHMKCLGCHLNETKEAGPVRVGPVECSGCHDEQKQKGFEIVEDPIRIERKQPDFVLLSAPEDERKSSRLNTVPFSHVNHEGFNSTCRVCHHESMKACNKCHTLQGTPESEGIKLERAFHDVDSDHSCVGCHKAEAKEPACYGCHSRMSEKHVSQRACLICHAGPEPEILEKVKDHYISLDQFKPPASEVKLTFDKEDLPEEVKISLLEDKYEPAVFPHHKVVERLMKEIKDNKIATHFHGNEDALCQGCHHHSPIGIKPPLCESCHGAPFDESYLGRPGLKGAYHQLCIGCHEIMKIKDPTDCNICHKEKDRELVHTQ